MKKVKAEKPEPRSLDEKGYDWEFEELKPGDSKLYHVKNHQVLHQAYMRWAMRGTFAIRKEANGYRLYLIKKVR